MKFFIAALLLLIPTLVWADSYEQTGPREAAVQVVCKLGSGASRGSGVFCGPDCVFTAAHVVGGSDRATVEIDGKRHTAIIARVNREMDVAVLLLDEPVRHKHLPLGHTRPKPGSKVEVWGFGPRVFRTFDGVVVKPITTRDEPWLIGVRGSHGQTTVSGDSGGAIVQNGVVVGIHWGYRERGKKFVISAVDCESIRDWMKNAH